MKVPNFALITEKGRVTVKSTLPNSMRPLKKGTQTFREKLSELEAVLKILLILAQLLHAVNVF